MKTQNDEMVDRVQTPRLPLKIRNFQQKSGAGLCEAGQMVKTDYDTRRDQKMDFENRE